MAELPLGPKSFFLDARRDEWRCLLPTLKRRDIAVIDRGVQWEMEQGRPGGERNCRLSPHSSGVHLSERLVVHDQAAIDVQGLPSDVAAGVRGEEDRCAAEIFRELHAAERNVLFVLEEFGAVIGVHRIGVSTAPGAMEWH
jgi:hypothetical protein